MADCQLSAHEIKLRSWKMKENCMQTHFEEWALRKSHLPHPNKACGTFLQKQRVLFFFPAVWMWEAGIPRVVVIVGCKFREK